MTDPAQFWDEHYARHLSTTTTSATTTAAAGRVNPRLAEVAGPLAAGAALDLGCGAGGDAFWLAGRGWTVTAVDISAVAVDALTRRARAAGAAVTARRVDLGAEFPTGPFDLISAQYLHTPFDLDRAGVLRRAAHALAPGGRLAVTDHGSIAPWSWNQDPDTYFPTPLDVAADLALDPDGWVVDRAESPQRQATGPSGQTATVTDLVLVIRRTGDRGQR